MDRLDADRMFVAVMETGSFTGAAERLGTSSGQASKLVSRLESKLGVRLLNRTTRSVSATEAGQAYFERMRVLLDEFDELDLSIRNISQAPRGRLLLTAPLTFGTVELAPALNDFAGRYPDIELDVSFSDRVVNLVDEGFDMAVRVGRPGDSSLIIRKLRRGDLSSELCPRTRSTYAWQHASALWGVISSGSAEPPTHNPSTSWEKVRAARPASKSSLLSLAARLNSRLTPAR